MNRTIKLASSLIACTGIAVAGASAAGASTTSAHKLSAGDRAFMKSNEQVNLAELALGKIALKRASGPRARMLAHMTISDHKKARAALEAVAEKDGVTLPTEPNAQQQKAAALLAGVSPHVALAYFKIQVPGHRTSIKQTEHELKDGSKHNVLKYAAYYLPVAQKHLRMAKEDLAELRSELSGN